ncbi:Crp/Fnr family transcriptional regulator [Falsiroseomonas oryziterrae]|uniref:Crp/Fnr family transcriptional regulator n=1 Tax=Falsiroseomonas oryziterrae TaxID=2911368 RepID=UPI001F2560A0|nr:Crp/Fnr family transcriptional regulator [Roseomonas sp. NPKOSM-4]
MDRARAHRIVLDNGWLAQQPAPFQAEILARADILAFGRGDHAFTVGDRRGGVHGIVEGSFAVHVAATPCDGSLAHVMRPSVWFGLSPLTRRPSGSLTFRALEPSWTLHVPESAVEEIVRSCADAARAVAGIAEASLQIAFGVIADLLIPDADRRIAAILLRVCGAGAESPRTAPAGCRLTQAELGEMANASRGLVNRTLRSFETEGWVRLGYNRIAVTDIAALTAFVNAGRVAER